MTKQAPKNAIRRRDEAPNSIWHVVAPADHSLADALSPTYLGAKVRLGDVKAGDHFDMRHEAHAFLVRGYITDVDKEAGAISYVTLEVVDLTQLPLIAYDYADAVVRIGGGGWTVARGDGAPIKGGFATEADATAWLKAKQTLSAAANVAAT